MMTSAVLSLCWTLSLCLSVSAGTIITDEPGQSLVLLCRAPSNTDIVAVNWTRPELEQQYVLLYRDGRSDPYNQLPSFKDRVELKDREMKDGDVTMTLKKVTSNDSGTYECRVIMRKTNIRKRGNLKTDPISVINLKVQSGDTEERGDEEGGVKEEGSNKGPVAGGVLALFGAVAGVGGVLFYRKRTGLPGQGSSKVPLDEESQPAPTLLPSAKLSALAYAAS